MLTGSWLGHKYSRGRTKLRKPIKDESKETEQAGANEQTIHESGTRESMGGRGRGAHGMKEDVGCYGRICQHSTSWRILALKVA